MALKTHRKFTVPSIVEVDPRLRGRIEFTNSLESSGDASVRILPGLFKFPDSLKTHQPVKGLKIVQWRFKISRRAGGSNMRVYRLHRRTHCEECSAGKDRELISDVREFLDRQQRCTATDDDVGQQRRVDALGDRNHLVYGFGRLDEHHIRTGVGIGPTPVNGFSQSVTGTGISQSVR